MPHLQFVFKRFSSAFENIYNAIFAVNLFHIRSFQFILLWLYLKPYHMTQLGTDLVPKIEFLSTRNWPKNGYKAS